MGNMQSRIKIDLADLVIKPLDPRMDRAAFSCGDEDHPSNKELVTTSANLLTTTMLSLGFAYTSASTVAK